MEHFTDDEELSLKAACRESIAVENNFSGECVECKLVG